MRELMKHTIQRLLKFFGITPARKAAARKPRKKRAPARKHETRMKQRSAPKGVARKEPVKKRAARKAVSTKSKARSGSAVAVKVARAPKKAAAMARSVSKASSQVARQGCPSKKPRPQK